MVTVAPCISPRFASGRPSSPTISIDGGRFGISSDWIGGNVRVTKPSTPATAIIAQSPSTRLQ